MTIITLVVAAFIFYLLFIKGFIFPILSLLMCYFAGLEIEKYFPQTKLVVATVMHYNISLAMVAAILIFFMSVGFFINAKED